ncbi:hypothetical protein KR074_001859, partial [Drosophila pseudoananassae]
SMHSPRKNNCAAETKKKEDYELKCESDSEKSLMLDNMPRHMDTFWRTDTAVPQSRISGRYQMASSLYNKGMAFTLNERRALRIHGLLPVATRTVDDQVRACQIAMDTFLTSEMQRYIFLTHLMRTNRRLFYRILLSDPDKYLPMVDATITVSLVSFHSLIYNYGQGLFITIKDLGHVHEILANWPYRMVRCILVSNGASVLSHGDLGVNEMSILFCKMHENVVFGGINPAYCLSVILDMGTNNEVLLNTPTYSGIKERRASPEICEKLFEEFTLAVLRQYGARALILAKDFDSKCALKQLERYRDRCCLMDADLQCLAACAVSGVIAANRNIRLPFFKNTFLFFGSETINIGMARLCIALFKREGYNDAKAHERVWFCDADGLIVHERGHIPDELAEFSLPGPQLSSLVEIIDFLQPNVLVGGSGLPKSFTPDVLRAMERSNQHPIIFAMSRPICKSECSAEDAFSYTKGRCTFISGSPRPRLKYANKWYQPGFCTSKYLMAGISSGIILAGLNRIPDEIFCVAADRLANLVWPCDLKMRNVFPPMRKIECISLQIAEAVFSHSFRRGLATLSPRPDNPLEYIRKHRYDHENVAEDVAEVYCMRDRHIATSESQNYYKLNI